MALVSDVFFEDDADARLRRRLAEARALGAELAVLPELPLNPWSPATSVARDNDAEEPEGRRHRLLSAAARGVSIGIVGGAIVRDAATGTRHNTALVFDRDGSLIASYRKVHLPDEEGFREGAHYEPGDDPPQVIRAFGVPLGLQTCSDINRPEGSQLLAALGAAAIINPRATEAATFERWKLVFRATALTASAYVLSVNRPGPDQGVALGGPSIAVDPDGNVLAESTDPIVIVDVDSRVVDDARRRYPGYLRFYPSVYARGWESVTPR